uniref:Reverse transcriptase domain-containing protein n=1 Tax=Tanacetum cinerariifolium TaxID=118510 RepID=A0A6L2M6X7_TANCI|nr:hypothetical protein [Tanacetum cinerariifolium]
MISISAQAPVPFLSKTEVARILAIPTPPPSLLTPYSPPLSHIPSPPLPASPTYPLGYRAAMIRLRDELTSTSHPPPPIVLLHTRVSMAMMRAAAPSTYILVPRSETPLSVTPPSGTPPLLPIPLPTLSPPLLLPSTDCKADVLEVTLPPWKRLCIALGPRFEVRESSSTPIARPAEGFKADYGFVSTLDVEIRCDPDREITYGITDSMDASDTTRAEVMSLRTIVLAHQTKIAGLWAADRTRQTHLVESLTLLKTLQTQMAALQSQQGPVKGIANALAARDTDRSQNGKDNHDSGTGVRRQAPPAHECTYLDFIKCKPLYSKVKTIGHDVAYEMTWINMKNKMTDKYCPRGEIKKLEVEMWNLKVKDKIERYVGDFPDMIHESVMASKPKTIQDAVEFATELMDKKIRTFVERQTENKRKFEDTSKKNQNQQQNKKQNTDMA